MDSLLFLLQECKKIWVCPTLFFLVQWPSG